jgi:hypothetical protein
MSIIAALVLIVVILLFAAFALWMLQLLWPGENKFKTAALGVCGLIVALLVFAVIFPSFGAWLGITWGGWPPWGTTTTVVEHRR